MIVTCGRSCRGYILSTRSFVRGGTVWVSDGLRSRGTPVRGGSVDDVSAAEEANAALVDARRERRSKASRKSPITVKIQWLHDN